VTALGLINVSASYGGRPALENANVTFGEGRLTGIVGPNGAGKTTLLRVALGILPFEGRVQLLGRSLAECSREFVARSIAYLPQESGTQWPMLVRSVVALGRMPYGREMDTGAVDDAMERSDVEQFAHRRMNELSAGERARVLLARALATLAPILLVDEPAAHLDPAHQLRLMELLRAEAERGVAVAITLHDLALASRFCDDVVVMRTAQVAGQGPVEQVLSDDALAHVFGIAAKRDSGAIVPWTRL